MAFYYFLSENAKGAMIKFYIVKCQVRHDSQAMMKEL